MKYNRKHRYSFVFSFVSGKYLSIVIDVRTPMHKNIKNNIILKNKFKLLLSIFNDSGIKSKSETHTITPDAKDNEEVIILSLFFDEKNITNVPNIVAKPANEVIKKL